jgi:hypothetical protein
VWYNKLIIAINLRAYFWNLSRQGCGWHKKKAPFSSFVNSLIFFTAELTTAMLADMAVAVADARLIFILVILFVYFFLEKNTFIPTCSG